MQLDRNAVQAALCERIAETLALPPFPEGPIHDHLGYEALAYLKLPGPDYLAVLRALHGSLKPKLYVEIGTRRGDSLALALPETRCIAIDPMPVVGPRPDTVIAATTSDNFFAIETNREKCRGFDLAFIDGDHSFDQALRDFENLERLAKPSSLICLHDVLPMDERTATPKCETGFWTGDVWRLMGAIVDCRQDLVAFTIGSPPTGLGVIGRFGGSPRSSVPSEHRNWWAGRAFPAVWAEQAKLLNIVPNNPASILAAFQGKQ
jgi:hypothetical protein